MSVAYAILAGLGHCLAFTLAKHLAIDIKTSETPNRHLKKEYPKGTCNKKRRYGCLEELSCQSTVGLFRGLSLNLGRHVLCPQWEATEDATTATTTITTD